jgi:hypothetical protein
VETFEETVDPTLAVLLAVSGLAAAGSLVLRFRRSRGEERQQLKWFTYAVALLPVFVLPGPGGSLLSAVPLVLLPVAVGIAILRYRLYDIDRLINRTLVYGLLTALLAGVYAGTVLVLGQGFGGVGKDPPSSAVAGAPLVVRSRPYVQVTGGARVRARRSLPAGAGEVGGQLGGQGDASVDERITEARASGRHRRGRAVQ